MKFSVPATLVLAIALNSCNNAADTKKQVDEQNAKIQSLVDAKMNDLQTAVNQQCAATVDSLANVEYATYLETAKVGKKAVSKVTHKTKAAVEMKKEDAKPASTKLDVGQQGSSSSNTHKLDVGQQDTPSSNTHKLNVGQKP